VHIDASTIMFGAILAQPGREIVIILSTFLEEMFPKLSATILQLKGKVWKWFILYKRLDIIC